MGEKKGTINVSIGTIICLVIIALLIIVLIGVVINNQNLEKKIDEISNRSEIESNVNIAENGNESNNNESTQEDIFQVSDEIITIQLKDGVASIKTSATKSEFENWGLKTSSIKLDSDFQEIKGFSSKIADVCIAGGEHEYIGTTFVFLMDDGTVEFSGLQNMIDKVCTEGKVEGLKGITKIEKIEKSNEHWSDTSVVAYDESDNKNDVLGIIGSI